MTNLTNTQHIRLLTSERDKWQRLAETDHLTQMPNRLALDRRVNQRDGWYILCDLNGFKSAQDAHPDGHAYGDDILREFAEFLETSTRFIEDRVAARTGGDEFLVWCPTREGARAIKQRVREWSHDGVTASAGMGETIGAADAAMYLSRKAQ